MNKETIFSVIFASVFAFAITLMVCSSVSRICIELTERDNLLSKQFVTLKLLVVASLLGMGIFFSNPKKKTNQEEFK